MPNVKGLLADPQFQQLSPEDQKAVLGRIDSRFSNLSDEDFGTFKQKMTAPAQEQSNQNSSASLYPTASISLDSIKRFVKGLGSSLPTSTPEEIVKGGITALARGNNAVNQIKQGHLNPMTALQADPIIGQAIAAPAQQAMNGNVAGAAGNVTGNVLQALLLHKLGAMEPAAENPSVPGNSASPSITAKVLRSAVKNILPGGKQVVGAYDFVKDLMGGQAEQASAGAAKTKVVPPPKVTYPQRQAPVAAPPVTFSDRPGPVAAPPVSYPQRPGAVAAPPVTFPTQAQPKVVPAPPVTFPAQATPTKVVPPPPLKWLTRVEETPTTATDTIVVKNGKKYANINGHLLPISDKK